VGRVGREPGRVGQGEQVHCSQNIGVFFTLSGFVITLLIMKEYLATGGLRLGIFYAKRLARLWPALLAVCAGKVGFECTIVRLPGGKEALLQRFIAPGSLDRISVEFEEGEDANGFVPPAWVGPEVTQNPAYHRGSLARTGLPASEDIPLSNTMLEELLDVIEEGTIAAQLGRGASPSVRDDWSAQGPSDGASLTEGLAPAIESVPADDLMAGLAEALKDVQLTKPASEADDDAAAREDTSVERARPRFAKGGWR